MLLHVCPKICLVGSQVEFWDKTLSLIEGWLYINICNMLHKFGSIYDCKSLFYSQQFFSFSFFISEWMAILFTLLVLFLDSTNK